MGTDSAVGLTNRLRGAQIVSVGMSNDGSEIYFDLTGDDRLTFRMLEGRPSIILGDHPNASFTRDLPTFKDYQR